jgi:hypothetical protein
MPNAVRETEKEPVSPEANRAENTAVSSFSTSPTWSLTGAARCPTTEPSGSGRSGTWVERTAPDTDTIGPQRNWPASMTWAPMSASAPEPGPPLNRQVSGPRGSQA